MGTDSLSQHSIGDPFAGIFLRMFRIFENFSALMLKAERLLTHGSDDSFAEIVLDELRPLRHRETEF